MEGAETVQLLFMVVLAIAVGGVIYVLVHPYLSGEKTADKRLQAVTEAKGPKGRAGPQGEQHNNRRKQVADTLKELEGRQAQREKVSLRLRMERAGMEPNPKNFWMMSGICGLVMAALTMLLMPSAPLFVAIVAGFVGALGLPRWILGKMTKRRQTKFIDEFANSIDIVVRGVKSGLPLNECLSIISRESPQPVGGEFAALVEQTRVGVPLADAFERMMQRMPLSEVKFFAIVIAIQQQAGGNLSEALGNLAGVLRDRKRMQAKVKALSSEAKASAGVLAALPFIVMALVYISTPDYMSVLWTTKMGKFMMACSAIWMTFGLLTMRKMINFKF
jgi:tight adherence protein B